METFKIGDLRPVDMGELCNLLIDNGYRLFKLPGKVDVPTLLARPFECSDPSRVSPQFAHSFAASGNFPQSEDDLASTDPFLEKELKEAYRRAELLKMEDEVSNPQLISALKSWRTLRAKAENVPSYFVLSNKTLLSIALSAPSTIEELLNVYGFGPLKAEKYATEILEIVARESEEACLLSPDDTCGSCEGDVFNAQIGHRGGEAE